MATENLTFATAVQEWANAQPERMRIIALESTQRLVSIIQSRVPVDTGFCRASVRASLESMPPIDPSAKGRDRAKDETGILYPYDSGVIQAEISNAQIGQTIFVGWTAVYANALEYGHSQQAPGGFVRISCAEWPTIVDQVVAEAKTIEGSS